MVPSQSPWTLAGETTCVGQAYITITLLCHVLLEAKPIPQSRNYRCNMNPIKTIPIVTVATCRLVKLWNWKSKSILYLQNIIQSVRKKQNLFHVSFSMGAPLMWPRWQWQVTTSNISSPPNNIFSNLLPTVFGATRPCNTGGCTDCTLRILQIIRNYEVFPVFCRYTF